MEVVEEEVEGRRPQMTYQGARMEGLMEEVEGLEGSKLQMTCQGARTEELMEEEEEVES